MSKTLENILEETCYYSLSHIASYDKKKVGVALKEAYSAGRDSIKEDKGEITTQAEKLDKNISKYIGKVELIEKIREDIKKEILEEVNKLNTKHPERESDEYDKGQEDFKNKVEDIIKGI